MPSIMRSGSLLSKVIVVLVSLTGLTRLLIHSRRRHGASG